MRATGYIKTTMETELDQVIKNFEMSILNYDMESTRAEIRKEFWSLVAERFMLTIIDNREPQPAPICHKCKESL
jgi:hypothetical protein